MQCQVFRISTAVTHANISSESSTRDMIAIGERTTKRRGSSGGHGQIKINSRSIAVIGGEHRATVAQRLSSVSKSLIQLVTALHVCLHVCNGGYRQNGQTSKAQNGAAPNRPGSSPIMSAHHFSLSAIALSGSPSVCTSTYYHVGH